MSVAAAGRGLAAGFVGTVALTASQMLEMRITGRPASDLPAKVAEGILGISLRGRRRKQVAFAAHWMNNTSSGLGRAVLGGAGLRGAPAVAGTFALYLGGEYLLFNRLGQAPPRLPIDAVHAGVWATVTSRVYELLERRPAPAPSQPPGAPQPASAPGPPRG